METIAENTTVVTKKLFYEAMAASDGYRRSARKGLGILAVLWLALLLGTVFMGMPVSLALLELIVVGAVGLWLLVLYPRSRYKAAFRALQQRSDGSLERRLHFYRDRLAVETAVSQTEFLYREIIWIETTKNAMILITADKTGVFFALNGFHKGTAQVVKNAVEQAIL